MKEKHPDGPYGESDRYWVYFNVEIAFRVRLDVGDRQDSFIWKKSHIVFNPAYLTRLTELVNNRNFDPDKIPSMCEKRTRT